MNGKTLCPACGECLRHAANVDGHYVPKAGDAVMCFICGEASVYDDAVPTKLRVPTEDEAEAINEHPDFLRIHEAWAAMRAQHILH